MLQNGHAFDLPLAALGILCSSAWSRCLPKMWKVARAIPVEHLELLRAPSLSGDMHRPEDAGGGRTLGQLHSGERGPINKVYGCKNGAVSGQLVRDGGFCVRRELLVVSRALFFHSAQQHGDAAECVKFAGVFSVEMQGSESLHESSYCDAPEELRGLSLLLFYHRRGLF